MSPEERANNEQNQSIEELRANLSEGGFGSNESETAGSPVDETPDEAIVGEFLSQFGAEGDTALKAHDWKAYVPSSMCNPSFWGPIFGIIREETESIYIFDSKLFEKDEYIIGYIDNGSYQAKTAFKSFSGASTQGIHVMGSYQDVNLVLRYYTYVRTEYGPTADAIAALRHTLTGELHIDASDFDVRIKQYDTVTNLFSRNTGLLESSIMLDKRAVLVGCGSVGSFVAMELARSGVGKFVLCDTDTLEIHNICRHQCGYSDLGRYKVDAVKDKILNINPNAEVITYRSTIQRVPEDELIPLMGRDTIIIGGGDNRASADWACKLAIRTDSTFVATCCWTRAFAGEIFYWASGKNLSCYHCAFSGLIDDERPESHATYFGSDEEKEKLSFEPGVAVDIDFVTIIAVKLALDLLNRDNPNYTPRVIDNLRQYTWVCNTNSTRIGGERAGIFSYPLQITRNLTVHKDDNCPFCGGK